MKKQNTVDELKRIESLLPYRAKTQIAKKIRGNKGNRHNVQTAFRGMAGEKLSAKVLEIARQLFPEQTKPLRKKKSKSLKQSL